MNCPHCGKETDSYIGIKVEGINLNLNNGCASGVLSYAYTVANGAAANPITIANPAINMAAGCANQNLGHYHLI